MYTDVPSCSKKSSNRSSTLECKPRQRDPFKNLGGGGTVGFDWREFDGGGRSLDLYFDVV